MVNVLETHPGLNLKVQVEQALEADDLPYMVQVDAHRAALALVVNGLPETALENLKLYLLRDQLNKNPFEDHVGMFSADDRTLEGTIYLSVNTLWESFKGRKLQSAANEFIFHEGRHAIDFYKDPKNGLRSSRIFNRLRWSISRIGVGMIGGALAAPLFGLTRQPVAGYLAYGLGIGSSLTVIAPLIYYIDPAELRANRFAREMNQVPEWQQIINIIPT